MASITHRGSAVLGYENAYHLLRRATYKVTKERIDEFAALTVDQALDVLFNFNGANFNEFVDTEPRRYDTGETIMYPGPKIVESGHEEGEKRRSVFGWYVNEAAESSTIRFKLSFFLHSIFITRAASSYLLNYDNWSLLLIYAKGSYKEFARKAAVDNLMHAFLNNNLNKAASPNENFAREFLELFTITKSTQVGADDYTTYTEHDVQQAARVLTGFTIDFTRGIIDPDTGTPTGSHSTRYHDTGNKTFSHRFGNQTITGATTDADMPRELDDFVNMVFAQDYTAISLARRLFRFFVHGQISSEVETDIIQPLATYLKANNYNLELGVRKLLASKHFYDEDDAISGDENKGGLIKTPLDLFLQTTNLFRIQYDTVAVNRVTNYRYMYNAGIRYFSKTWGVNLFNATTVAGFVPIYQEPDYDRQWVSVNTILSRYKLGVSLIDARDRVSNSNSIINGQFNAFEFLENSGYFTDILANLYANPTGNAATEMPRLMLRILEITLVKPLSTERYNYFYNSVLLGGLSETNWAFAWKNYKDGSPDGGDVEITIKNVFLALLESPEYQIF
jgi:uncharacterized protein (DUF1800 family)